MSSRAYADFPAERKHGPGDRMKFLKLTKLFTQLVVRSATQATRREWLLGGILALVGGCLRSGYYPVSGRVVDKDGKPIPELESWQIIFSLEEGVTSSEGELRADGSFEAYTFRPRDGVPPGDYRVYLPRRHLDPERAAPAVLEPIYERPETSPLHATVEPKRNYFEFQVERIRLSRR
jgi:hypothetical protein